MKKITVFYSICAVALLALAAFGQEETFSNPNVEYTFSLPNGDWKMTVPPSATSPNVEYVFGDRVNGHLDVRKLTVAEDTILSDVIHGDEEQKLQFKPGFVAGKEERFSGRFSGTVYNFEYVASSRTMSGRYYFLRTNDTTVYVLRFTGRRDSLQRITNQTDSIARTFAVK